MRSLLIGVATFACVAFMGADAFAQEVRVTLTDVQARSGQIMAALQTETQFLRGRGAYDIVSAPRAGTMTLVFRDVAPGKYALVIMHDENGDNRMGAAANGMPTEGWAFSGPTLMGPPTFAGTSFDVGAVPVTVSVNMFYPYVPPAGQ